MNILGLLTLVHLIIISLKKGYLELDKSIDKCYTHKTLRNVKDRLRIKIKGIR